jgi:hypothetical protein
MISMEMIGEIIPMGPEGTLAPRRLDQNRNLQRIKEIL